MAVLLVLQEMSKGLVQVLHCWKAMVLSSPSAADEGLSMNGTE